jgi:hypothetical protein
LIKPVVDFPLENLILAESTQFRTSQLTRSGGTLPAMCRRICKKENMEFIWTFPLFIVFPIIGLLLIGIGIIKARKRKSKTPLFIGISLLALPFIYLAFTSILQLGLENKLAGKYDIGNENETLTLKNDGTFELKSSINFLNSGSGTWEIQEIDFPILILNFNEKSDVWLEIKESESSIRLSSMPGESNITSEFIQQPQSR